MLHRREYAQRYSYKCGQRQRNQTQLTGHREVIRDYARNRVARLNDHRHAHVALEQPAHVVAELHHYRLVISVLFQQLLSYLGIDVFTQKRAARHDLHQEERKHDHQKQRQQRCDEPSHCIP